MNMEIWTPINNYEEIYEISNFGNIKNIKRNKIMKPFVSKKTGYLQIDLCKNGNKKRYNIHRLVAIHFVDNFDNYNYINHKDENRKNNKAINLEWCTQKYNCNYGSRNLKISRCSKGRKHKPETKDKISKALSKTILQYNKENDFIKEWRNAYEVARELKVSPSNINACCNNKRKSAYGYIWKFKKEEFK